jgi:hypothetical protein
MKFTLTHITGFILLTSIGGMLNPVNAQENRPYQEPDVIVKYIKIDITSPESEPVTVTRPQRDSVQVIVKPAPKPIKATEKSTKDKHEDPLSFNFLYYIIEKFKLSDIIE